MNSDPATPTEPNQFIAQQLQAHLADLSYRQIAFETGMNVETTRRFMNGITRISAEFVHIVCTTYDIDANLIVRGEPARVGQADLSQLETSVLLQELGKRLIRIEDCAVGRSVLKEQR